MGLMQWKCGGLALLLLVAAAPSAQAELKFGVANEPYPPFTVKDATGQWVGWEVDLMHALCTELKETCTLEEVSWDGLIPSLTSGKYDAIMSSMSVTPEREKVINFSHIYYNSRAAFVGAKNGDLDISPEHLSGKVIGVQASTIFGIYVTRNYEPKGAQIKTYATQDEVNADMAAGRLDYVVADAVAMNQFVHSEQGAECCEQKQLIPPDPAIFGKGAGFGVRKEDTVLLDKLNTTLKHLSEKGIITSLTTKWKLDGLIELPSY